MLAIGRCLMGRPELIMFDEPSLGLAPNVVQQLLQTIHTLNQKGLTVLLVEQNVAVSLKLSQHAYVLENGRIVMSASEKNCSATSTCAWHIWDFDRFKQPDGFNRRLRGSHCVQRVGLFHPGNCTTGISRLNNLACSDGACFQRSKVLLDLQPPWDFVGCRLCHPSQFLSLAVAISFLVHLWTVKTIDGFLCQNTG